MLAGMFWEAPVVVYLEQMQKLIMAEIVFLRGCPSKPVYDICP